MPWVKQAVQSAGKKMAAMLRSVALSILHIDANLRTKAIHSRSIS